MNRVAVGLLSLLSLALAVLPGCSFFRPETPAQKADMAHFKTAALAIEYPQADETDLSNALSAAPPRITLDETTEYWDLTLEEAVKIGLQNTKVLKDLGGLVMRTPTAVRTIQDPALTELDPRFGVESALAAFDPTFSSSVLAQHNDRVLNNIFFGGGIREFQQDLVTMQSQIGKRTVAGSQFFMRSYTEYDANNAPGNAFPSAWLQYYEGEFRQSLLQGAGLYFNRVAGIANGFGQQSSIPGVYNGVLIARINTDISLADFELGVRNFMNDLENAYLDLYFAYRDLQAKLALRNAALQTWRTVKALLETGQIGGDAFKEAQAREQYYRFEEAVQNAVHGTLVEGTRTGSGAAGGTFRGAGGLLVAERRLRLLMGVPITDAKLIRPIDEPQLTRVVFDWHSVLEEGLTRRVELRRQRWEIKARELELIASRNYLLPSLDITGRWRFRGLGNDLAAPGFGSMDPLNQSAFNQLFGGHYQESQGGIELNFPFGFRRAHAAVRHAELRLARERSILREQERQLVYEMSNCLAETDRAYEVALTNYNRREAARAHLETTQDAYQNDRASLELLLDAQRRLYDADSAYYRSLVEYAVAIKNVHFEKGSLLDYNNVYLEEGPWPAKAYADRDRAESLRTGHINVPFLHPPRIISGGLAPQLALPPGTAQVPAAAGEEMAPAPTAVGPDGEPQAAPAPEPASPPPAYPPPTSPSPGGVTSDTPAAGESFPVGEFFPTTAPEPTPTPPATNTAAEEPPPFLGPGAGP